MGEVDAFLDRLVEALVRGGPAGQVLDAARFQEVRMREGYDIDEVDHLVLTVATEASSFDPSAVEVAARLHGAAEERVAATGKQATHPSVIEARPGLWQRVFGRRG
jgi:hypothetical protein